MITLEEPHMAINSADITSRYQMWNTWSSVTSAQKREKIIRWVATVAKGAPGGKLKHLVINAHGSPAHFSIGEGFGKGDVKLFSGWIGLVDKIWLVACNVGEITSTADGNMFLFNIATNARCHVVASTESQYARAGRVYPYGQVDTFEGLVLSYSPAIGVTWSQRYPSDHQGE